MTSLVAMLVLVLTTFSAAAQESPASKLTMEQQHTLIEFLKSEKVPTQRIAAPEPGGVVPTSVELIAIPVQLGKKIPQIKQHLYFATESEIVLVRSSDRKVSDVIKLK